MIFFVTHFNAANIRQLFFFMSLMVAIQTKAQISANITEGCAPLSSVVFSHSYGNINNLIWDFGDDVTSNLNNPTHTYQDPGIYLVTFTADGGVSDNLEITVHPNPQANFEIVGQSIGEIPLTVEFLDLSTPAPGGVSEIWRWDFGDGTVLVSDEDNPIHDFTLMGIFSVSLLVTDNHGCSDFFTIDDAVKTCIPPDVNLVTSPLSACTPPLAVNFSVDASSNSSSGDELSYTWDLGNGNTDDTADPPEQNYTSDGTYPITYSVTDDLGCTYEGGFEVFIGSISADWEVIGGPFVCTDVSFINNSDPGETVVIWAPGQIEEFELAPNTINHTFAEPGEYNPIIYVSSDGCSDSDTLNFTVTEAVALFNSDPNIGCAPELTVGYLGMTPNVSVFEWIFESGEPQYGPYVQHTYSVPISQDPYDSIYIYTFSTQLKVTTNFGCQDLFVGSNDTILNPYAAFAVNRNKGCAPLNVIFSDSSKSVTDIINWYWNTGDGTVFTTQDPEGKFDYDYPEPGDYNSFLVIETAAGCLDTSFVIPIHVGTQVDIEVAITPTQVCPGETIDFQATAPNGEPVDLWNFQSDLGMLSGDRKSVV